MNLIYTEQAFIGLEESLAFIAPKVSYEKLMEIRTSILDMVDTLILDPLKGQREPYFESSGLEYRRLIEGHYKIIYRVIDENIYITDIFDSRQDPEKMKS